MVTDGILCAVQGMTDRFDTTEAKNAGNAIFEMLADFDEGMWEKLTNSYAVGAWLSQHIKKAFISNPLRERFTYGEEGLITKSDILRAMNTGGIKFAENAYGCCGICCLTYSHD